MPSGIYKHKPQQGFQKGHKIGVGNKNTAGKKIHSEETKKQLSIKMMGNKFAMGRTGEKSGRWKGGFPDCLNCGKKVSTRNYLRCKSCNEKYCRGILRYNWKGGYENKKIYIRKRIILKLGLGGNYNADQWNELKAKYGFMCLCCKKVEPEIKLTADHIIPITQWKTYIQFHSEIKYQCNDIENIQPLCRSCNSRKGIKIENYLYVQ